MEENERLELLQAVASCAPKEMKTEYWCPEPFLKVSSDGSGVLVPRTEYAHIRFRGDFYREYPYLALQDSVEDGAAVAAMLDAMEKAGWFPRIGNNVYRRYWCSVYDHNPNTPRAQSQGGARAEAVSRAFVAVFLLSERNRWSSGIFMNTHDYGFQKKTPSEWAPLVATSICNVSIRKELDPITRKMYEWEFFDLIEGLELECYT